MTKGIIFDWVGTLYQFDGKGLFPYSERVLRKLHRDYRLSLIPVTKFDIDERLKEIRGSGLSQYFRNIIIDIIRYPEQYLDCMKKMGTNPKTTLIVSDKVENIELGNRLGCETIWIRSGANEFPDVETGQPNRTIGSIEDLIEIL